MLSLSNVIVLDLPIDLVLYLMFVFLASMIYLVHACSAPTYNLAMSRRVVWYWESLCACTQTTFASGSKKCGLGMRLYTLCVHVRSRFWLQCGLA